MAQTANVRARTSTRYWWVLAIAAGLSLLAGIIVLAAPKSSLETIALILGIYLVAIGINGFVTGFTEPEALGEHRTLALVMATLAVIAGIIAIVRPDATVKGVALAFGIYLILSGIRYLALATILPYDRGVAALHGLLEVIGGVIVVVWPKIGLTTLAVILGIYLLLAGFVQMWAALALRRAGQAAT
jgi:uncharacterized membrane protein HdeD (DUF308 family)